jgi:large subunit ribosomal protein L3
MKFILAKKLEMSQVFQPDGTVIPVTLVKAGPCTITQVKTKDQDGYVAVQLGFETAKKLAKPQAGHLKDLPQFKTLREFRVDDASGLERGQAVDAASFAIGDTVEITGTSKGKGFQGVVKRHHFHGHPSSHGHKDQQRMPGSIGAGGVQKVMKGRRMAGRMGGDTVTVKNLKVVEIRDNGILAIKGAVPGARNSIIEIKTA